MSLLLSRNRFVVAFLPTSKHLLISWLQSSSTVIWESKKENMSLVILLWEKWRKHRVNGRACVRSLEHSHSGTPDWAPVALAWAPCGSGALQRPRRGWFQGGGENMDSGAGWILAFSLAGCATLDM